MHRLFIAIPIPVEIKNKLIKARDGSGLSLKFIPAENLHVTVLFLGNVLSSDLLAIPRIIEKTVNGISPFTLIPDVMDKKVNGRNNMLWVRFKKSDAFEELSFKISDALEYPVDRKPLPHINLVRSKHKIHGDFPLFLPEIQMEVTKIELWESMLKSSGTTYSSLNSFTLKGSRDGKEDG